MSGDPYVKGDPYIRGVIGFGIGFGLLLGAALSALLRLFDIIEGSNLPWHLGCAAVFMAHGLWLGAKARMKPIKE